MDKTGMKRDTFCGKINEDFDGKTLTVYGWISNIRELGGITFLDVRDREGILQVVINENFSDTGMIKSLGREYVIAVTGTVAKRATPNPKLYSGKVELVAESIEVLSQSEVPPFSPENKGDVSEELRYTYRYLDLRDSSHQSNFKIRSDVNLNVRNYLNRHGFLDIETPMLTKATPEGARDYLVPSRVYKGKMFALPQSPQLFKQLLMVSGFERYYQIVKCFRDEDLRADRQPEFTQIDIEMSFSQPEELFKIIEGMMGEIFTTVGTSIPEHFPVKSYEEVFNTYGTDRPDLRNPLKITDFSEAVAPFGSNILDGILKNGGAIKGIVCTDSSRYSRKILDQINQFVQANGGKGAIWIKHGDGGFKSSIKTDPQILEAFYQTNEIDKDDIVFLIGDNPESALEVAGKLRDHLGKESINKDDLEFLWVVDFPLFGWNREEDRLQSMHHPFTAPHPDDMEKLETDPLKVRSVSYDLVLNGVEIGGGSQRINSLEIQKKIFQLLKLSDEEIENKFGFFLKALAYGAPPHLGIAMGFDRIIMLLTGEESIRETIAFPKTTSSLCLLTGSPSGVPTKQLDELGIRIKEK